MSSFATAGSSGSGGAPAGPGAAGGAPRVKRVMTQAINLMYEFLKNRERVQVWLYENTSMKIVGVMVGFDEYMNMVLDSSEEIHLKTNQRNPIGRILLKGDTVTLIQRAVV